jgi:hypothetical protein
MENAMRRWMKLVEGIRAYHGSPYNFAQFDLTAIGSGEGSQMHGYGLYFAADRVTARSYQAMAGNPARRQGGLTRVGRDQAMLDSLIRLGANKYAGNDVKRFAEVVRKHPNAFDHSDAILQRIEQWNNNQPPCFMYEVEIDADPNQFLEWDRPLSEQHPDVQRFFEDRGVSLDKSGAQAYRGCGPAPALSAALAAAGVPGTAYLDASQRRKYVVFDPAIVRVTSQSS